MQCCIHAVRCQPYGVCFAAGWGDAWRTCFSSELWYETIGGYCAVSTMHNWYGDCVTSSYECNAHVPMWRLHSAVSDGLFRDSIGMLLAALLSLMWPDNVFTFLRTMSPVFGDQIRLPSVAHVLFLCMPQMMQPALIGYSNEWYQKVVAMMTASAHLGLVGDTVLYGV